VDNSLFYFLKRSIFADEIYKFYGYARKELSSIAILIALVGLIKDTP